MQNRNAISRSFTFWKRTKRHELACFATDCNDEQPLSLTQDNSMQSISPAGRSLRSCICQLSRVQISAAPSRQASTSSGSAGSQEKLGWFNRIRIGAQKGAVDRRPPHARVEREMQKMELAQGNGSLFDRALAEAEVVEQSSGKQSRSAKMWTEVSYFLHHRNVAAAAQC